MTARKAEPDFEAYRHCRLCPRECGVDRVEGRPSYCGETATCRVASAGPHFGEEPPFSGTHGSGTIFFTGCSSACFFCQNYQISQEGLGREYGPDELVDLAYGLSQRGVHNINFVTPDHFWPHLAYVCGRLRERGVGIPFLFNCSGYERPEMVEQYAEHMDLFMPDFKFAQGDLAQACIGDRRYPDIALRAIAKMVEAKGFLDPWDPTGLRPARRGVLVRHLILPGHLDNTLEALDLLRREFGPQLPLSLMSQFRPVPACRVTGDMTRPIRRAEHEEARRKAEDLGFERAFLQDYAESTEFLPDFEREEPFEGNRGGMANG
ncbi:MAG: radical SAM protein [Kiritimatiellae bacterium]|nr:radical SAM protein [Kiritimatiellia bacterium]